MGLALSRLAGRRLLWGRVILCGVAIVGAVVVPMSCEVAGWALLIAILLAPATRIGYLIYPMNLFVWSWMLRPSPDEIPAPRLAVP